MFCIRCGAEILEGSHFCNQCGIPLQEDLVYAAKNDDSATKLVKAQCTNCNAPLDVDATQAVAICPFCNTPYIVEQAINNYNVKMTGNMNIANATINVNNGMNLDNLILRAQKFEQDGDYESALQYYNKVLDIDINQKAAQESIDRLRNDINEYVYFRVDANTVFSFGSLLLKRGKIIFLNKKGKETVYYIERIKNPRVTMGCIGFIYDGKGNEITYGCAKAKMMVEMIINAQNGIYPEMKFSTKENDTLAADILSRYDKSNLVLAIKYCREQTGWGLKEAKEYVEEIYK